MAKTRTSLEQVSPANPLEARITEAEAHTRSLRRTQELARISYGNAIRTLRATPKDSAGYEHARYQLDQAKKAYLSHKSATEAAQVIVDLLKDSIKNARDEAIAQASKAVAKENKAWAKAVKRANAPFEISLASKIVKIRKQSIGVVYAPCGCGCADAATADAHARYCPECKRIAEEHELSFIQTGAVISPQEA